MLHEFRIVNLAITFNVCKKVQRVAFWDREAKHVAKALQAFLVLVEFEESVIVRIKLPKLFKESILVVLRHLDVGCLEMTQVAKLCLTPHSVNRVVLFNFFNQGF